MINKRIKEILSKTVKLIRRFNPTKKNFAILGISLTVIVAGTYFFTHHFSGDFSRVNSLELDGKYYKMMTEEGNVKLSKNGKVKLDKFYKRVDADSFRKVDYAVFKNDLNSSIIEIRTNLANQIQYYVVEETYESVTKGSRVDLGIEGNSLIVASTGINPDRKLFFINTDTHKIENVNDTNSIAVNVSSEEFLVEFREDQKESIIEMLPLIENELMECFNITPID